jgi:hypothetical protein
MTPVILKDSLERLYRQYNRREFVHPDPLEFLYHYEGLCDREIVAFVASSLAYGRVAHILKSVSFVLERMKPTPSIFLKRTSLKTMHQTFPGFRHRFTDDQKLCAMLFGVKKVIERHGSLKACFSAGLNDVDDTILPALSAFTRELTVCAL